MRDLMPVHQQTPTPVASYNRDVAGLALPAGAIARLGRGQVSDLAFSPDGHYFAVGSDIGLWFYKIPTMAPIALREAERGLVSAVAFSPNGKWIATGNWEGDIKISSTQHTTLLARLKLPMLDEERHGEVRVEQIVFSPDGQYLAASGDQDVVYVWDLETHALIAKLIGETEGRAQPFPDILIFSFSPDGRLLASISKNTILVWDVVRGEKICHFCGHTNWIYSVNFSPCGSTLVSGSADGTARVWNIKSGQQKNIYRQSGVPLVYPFHLLTGELIVAKIYGNRVEVWNPEQGKTLATIKLLENVRLVRSSDKGDHLAIANLSEIKVWKAAAPPSSNPLTILGHTRVADSLEFSLDGKTLACSYWGDGVRLWDIARKSSKNPLEANQSKTFHSVGVSASGEIISTSFHGNTVKVWNIEKGEMNVELINPNKLHRRGAVAFEPICGMLAISDSVGTIHVWDMQHWTKLHTFIGHTDWIHSMRFSQDGTLLASASKDLTARLWNVKLGVFVGSLPCPKRPGRIGAIAFSSHYSIIAGGFSGEIRIWSIPCCETFITIPQPHGFQNPFALVFSPCGQYLASGAWWQGTDKVPIQLWDVASGENIVTFWGHPTDIQSLAFSPDGALLASGSYDGTILLWDMTPYL